MVGLFKMPRRQFAPVQTPCRSGNALRIGQQPYWIGSRMMPAATAGPAPGRSRNSTNRMDHRFGVNNDLNAAPARRSNSQRSLDDLQRAVVHQRGGIDRDFRPHLPGGMPLPAIRPGVTLSQIVARLAAEGTSRRCRSARCRSTSRGLAALSIAWKMAAHARYRPATDDRRAAPPNPSPTDRP